MPSAAKPSWPMNSAVTSTTVVEMAITGATPPRTAARAPTTKPPSEENGRSSPEASRTRRAKNSTGQFFSLAFGSSTSQAAARMATGMR
jgi:hypothetical protein